MEPKPEPTKHALEQRQWRIDNPENTRANSKRYREKPGNKEKQAKRHREWVEKNRDRARANQAAWRKANPEKVRAQTSKQNHARKLNRDEDSVLYGDVLRGDPCSYCGGPAGVVDHVVPLSKGGDNDWTNLTAACAACNGTKHARPLLLWMALRPISTRA